jgi:hypothetical protein
MSHNSGNPSPLPSPSLYPPPPRAGTGVNHFKIPFKCSCRFWMVAHLLRTEILWIQIVLRWPQSRPPGGLTMPLSLISSFLQMSTGRLPVGLAFAHMPCWEIGCFVLYEACNDRMRQYNEIKPRDGSHFNSQGSVLSNPKESRECAMKSKIRRDCFCFSLFEPSIVRVCSA